MKLFMVILFISLAMVMVGCMPNSNTVVNTPNVEGSISGFWMGLWQGIICPISWFISLFTNTINVYEVHNNGGWYNFGFVLGAGILGGTSSSASKSKK